MREVAAPEEITGVARPTLLGQGITASGCARRGLPDGVAPLLASNSRPLHSLPHACRPENLTFWPSAGEPPCMVDPVSARYPPSMTQRNRWVRSWLPEEHKLLQGNRPRVIDHIERFPIDNYDYRPLIADHAARFPGQGLIHVDWDTAFGIETRDAFERRARAQPESVLVAPVRIYPDSTALDRTVWNHRVPIHPSSLYAKYTEFTGSQWRWVQQDQDTEAALFGFGMLYIPYDICLEFCKATLASKHYNDYEFSKWHYEKHGLVPISWDIIPVHIHWESAFEE